MIAYQKTGDRLSQPPEESPLLTHPAPIPKPSHLPVVVCRAAVVMHSPCLRLHGRPTCLSLWALLQRTSSQDERLERMAQHRRGSGDFDLLGNDEGWDEVTIRRHLLGKLLTRAGGAFRGCCSNWAKQHPLQEAQQASVDRKDWLSVRICFCSGRFGRRSPNARSRDCDLSGSSVKQGVSIHRPWGCPATSHLVNEPSRMGY